MTHRVAVVGLGYFSQFHLASWAAMDNVDVVGCTDLSEERRIWAAKSFKLPVLSDLDAVLDRRPNIIDLVAPPMAHAALIAATAAPDRTIICQKPFCRSLEEARDVAAQARAAGARVIIHENFRFQPWYRTMKTVLDSGRMGQVWQARFALRPGDGRGPRAYLDRQPTFQSMKRLLIHETGVHFIDLFRWLLGDVASVFADLQRLNPVIAGEDSGLLILEHESGGRSIFDGNRLADHVTDAPRRTMGEMLIEGEGGALSLNGRGEVHFRAFGSQQADRLPLAYPPDDASFGGGCVDALNRHVVAALDGDGAFENEAAEYLPIVALSELAYASAERGRRMRVTM